MLLLGPRLIPTLILCLSVFWAFSTTAFAAEPEDDGFGLRDGDTVVFLGDSITAARDYTKVIELYSLMRFPDRKIAFFNGGKGGDTATTCIQRLQRDVFDRRATVVTIALGVNDIGWGLKADAEHKQAYLSALKTIIEQCQSRKIRVYLCSPAITAEDPDRAEAGFLQQMSDEGLQLAKSLGARTIDIQRGMRSIQRTIKAANDKEKDTAKHTELHAADGVHLNSLGQLAMAFTILKGLGAPADVSSATVEVSGPKVIEAAGCEITDLSFSDGIVRFDRLDQGYPLNRGTFAAFDHRWVPIPNELNRYLLAVRGLPAGDYELRVNTRLVGTVRAPALAHGLNISSMTSNGWEPGGPWEAQSQVVKELVDARDRLGLSQLLQGAFGASHPQSEKLSAEAKSANEQLEALQRLSARPTKLHFELRRVTKSDAK